MNVRALRRFQEALPNDPLVLGNIGTSSTASTYQLVSDNIANRLVVLNATTGINNIKLPKSTGSGTTITFLVGLAASASNLYIIKTAGTDVYSGSINVYVSAGTAKLFVSTANATITLDGAHQGGLIPGDYIQVMDILAGTWGVDGNTEGTTAVSTPFS